MAWFRDENWREAEIIKEDKSMSTKTELETAKKKYQEYLDSVTPKAPDYSVFLAAIYNAADVGKSSCVLNLKEIDDRVRSRVLDWFKSKGFIANYGVTDESENRNELWISGWTY